MLDYGVNFLTFQPVGAEALKALSETLRPAWDSTGESDTDDHGELFGSSQPLPVTVLSQIANQPAEQEEEDETGTAENARALETLLSNSVASRIEREAVDRPGAGQTVEGGRDSQPQTAKRKRRRRGNSSAGTAKKQRAPTSAERVSDGE